MIESEKYAVDINGEILETAGMIDIDLKTLTQTILKMAK